MNQHHLDDLDAILTAMKAIKELWYRYGAFGFERIENKLQYPAYKLREWMEHGGLTPEEARDIIKKAR